MRYFVSWEDVKHSRVNSFDKIEEAVHFAVQMRVDEILEEAENGKHRVLLVVRKGFGYETTEKVN